MSMMADKKVGKETAILKRINPLIINDYSLKRVLYIEVCSIEFPLIPISSRIF